MKRVLYVLCLFSLPLALQAQPDPKRFEKAIEAFEAKDKETTFPKDGIVFTGSSSFTRWTELPKVFAEFPVLNRGFGGSQTSDVNHYLDRIVLVHKPKVVVLFCGGNDLQAKRTPEQVHEEYVKFAGSIHKALPQAKVVFLSIHVPPSRIATKDQILKLNALTEEMCKKNPNMHYVSIQKEMLGADGEPNPELYVKDRLHPSAKAYEIWAEKLRPVLAKLMK